MRIFRKWSPAAFFLLAALSLSACMRVSLAPDDAPPAPAPEAAPHVATLEFWHTYSDLETKVFLEQVLPLFHRQYPHIRIDAVRKDYTDQLKDTVLAAVADNKAPDVMRMDIIWVPEFAKRGALSDVSALPGFQDIRGQFIGSLIQTNQYKGSYYGLPVNANTRAAIFNTRLLREAGLDAPPATFDELADAARRLKRTHPDAYGIGICCSNGWGSLPYFWTLGGELTDDAYARATGYLNGEGSRAALSKLKAWLDEGIVSPSITGGTPGTWDGILKGQLLMIDDAHWFYTVNETGPNRPLLADVVSSPFPDDVRVGTSVLGGENLVLFESSGNKQEAWTFMRWMTTEEPQRLMAETGLIPTIKHLQAKNDNPLFATYLEQLSDARPRPPVPAWTDIEDVFARMIERIMTGEQSVEAATDEAAKRIDALLRE
ncbi:extracellular solute-binding protein [Paenibacillus sp.]|uniref:extracellular solute-binding protein n=1 Tax=Paenibacillus sp. TaxID=58172 RepID=UPI002D482C69|nr:extracellular solute-binding protein [Paenibacillus sp.]HZG55013.1 extracellular solute-binding protein [Paenibacillus sp.]